MVKSSTDELQQKCGYRFQNLSLLKLALTHSSYANEVRNDNKENNERIEFLGDAVLEVVVSEYLYTNYPSMPEGELTKLRAGVVREHSIAKKARQLELSSFIYLGKGEESSRDNMRDSILADAFEAVTGAIYLDGGLDAAKTFLLGMLEGDIKKLSKSFRKLDCKTRLQEIVQKKGRYKLQYEITGERGPDHNKVFVAQVMLGTEILGQGEGRSKKEAEQSAANAALRRFENEIE